MLWGASTTASPYGMDILSGVGYSVALQPAFLDAGNIKDRTVDIDGGCHTYAFVLDSVTRVYKDGVEQQYTTAQVAVATAALTSGYYALGSGFGFTANQNDFVGSIQYAEWYKSAVLTASQVAQETAYIAAHAPLDADRPAIYPGVDNRLAYVGDSLTYGLGLTTPSTQAYPALVSTTPSYTAVNLGTSSNTSCNAAGADFYRTLPNVPINGSRPMMSILLGTNDLYTSSTVPLDRAWACLRHMVVDATARGVTVFVSTVPDRNGFTAQKNTWDNILRSEVPKIPNAVLVDDDDPTIMADGAAPTSGTANTNFQADGVHWNANGHVVHAVSLSNAMNWFLGSKPGNPSLFTASATLTWANAYSEFTPAAAATYTLPSCVGPSGQAMMLNNMQSANAVTVKTASSVQPVNGADYSTNGITVPSNGRLTLRAVGNPTTTGGCHWEM